MKVIVTVDDDDDGRHLVSHDGLHQLLLKGLPVSPHSCREKGNLQTVVKRAKHEIDMRTTTKTRMMMMTGMTFAPASTSLALVSSSSPRLGIRPPQQWLL